MQTKITTFTAKKWETVRSQLHMDDTPLEDATHDDIKTAARLYLINYCKGLLDGAIVV